MKDDHSEMSNIVEIMRTASKEASIERDKFDLSTISLSLLWESYSDPLGLEKLLPRSPSKLTALKKYGHDIDVGDGPKMVEFHD